MVCRSVKVAGRRASLRLEAPLWRALEEIADKEGLTISALCGEIDARRGSLGLTAAARSFIVGYFRSARARPGGLSEAARPFSGEGEAADAPSLLDQALNDAVPLADGESGG